MVGEDLRLGELVIFTGGRSAVITTLTRAAISGHVGGQPEANTDWWADIMDREGSMVDTIRLDRGSWNALKNRWMRCKMEHAA